MNHGPQKQPSVAKIEAERKVTLYRVACMEWHCPHCGLTNRKRDEVPKAGSVICASCETLFNVDRIIYDNGAEAKIG